MTTFKEIVDIEKKANSSLTSYEKKLHKDFLKKKEEVEDAAKQSKQEIKEQLEKEYAQKYDELNAQVKNIENQAQEQAKEFLDSNTTQKQAEKIVEGVKKYV